MKIRNKLNIAWPFCLKRLLCGIQCFAISICDSMSHFNAGANLQKEGTTGLKELTKRIMTFDYGKIAAIQVTTK